MVEQTWFKTVPCPPTISVTGHVGSGLSAALADMTSQGKVAMGHVLTYTPQR
jgi:hypothetical protein